MPDEPEFHPDSGKRRLESENRNLRLLIISEYFGEEDGPAGLVVSKYVRFLSQFTNVKFDLLTSRSPWNSVPSFVLRRRVCNVRGIRQWEDRLLGWLAGETAGTSWGVRARLFLNRRLERRRYDLVLAWTNPVSSLFAALAPKVLESRTPIMWRADDPYPAALYPSFRGDNGEWKRYRCDDAELIIQWLNSHRHHIQSISAPSRKLADLIKQKLGWNHCQLVDWPHIGGDGSLVTPDWNNLRGRCANLGYIGRLSENRSPLPILGALRHLNKRGLRYHLNIYGFVDRQWEDEICRSVKEGDVSYCGKVSFEQSLRAMRANDALLLIEAQFSEGVFLPSKFCDYVWANRPLLVATPSGSVVEKALGGGGFPGLVGYTVDSAISCLERFYTVRSGEKRMARYLCRGLLCDPDSVIRRSLAGIRNVLGE